jgi:MFS-type transporter involved in bile tolerance (Atg22 family)
VGAVCLFATVEPGMVVWGFVVSVISYIWFEGALVFYNAYLPEIAPRQFQGRVSGWGFAVGYAGSLLAQVLALISWGAAGWHISFDVLERLLAGEPMGRSVGADAMKFAGWQRLTAEYAKQFGVETPNWPTQAAQKS